MEKSEAQITNLAPAKPRIIAGIDFRFGQHFVPSIQRAIAAVA